MSKHDSQIPSSRPLRDAVLPAPDKIVTPAPHPEFRSSDADAPILVLLAAGKGTRFGSEPKCIQPVHGTPLARHSIESFRRLSAAPAICLVGYRYEQVAEALGDGAVCVLSENPAGGTAFAAYEAFSVPGLAESDRLIVITMGDRFVPPSIFRRLCEAHRAGDREADVTFLTARYEPPKNRGKGRVLRGAGGRIEGILEERDILAQAGEARDRLLALTEGNCPLYCVRASKLRRYLEDVTDDNAQKQYYLTDIVHAMVRDGGDVRTITTSPDDPEYDLLCCDVTNAMDLAVLEGTLSSSRGLLFREELDVEDAAALIESDRPAVQVHSIASQLHDIAATASIEELGFDPARPVAIGISGGRVRIAFMHPDMSRFFGPAWQMPIGAGKPGGEDQVVVMAQPAADGKIHLYPMRSEFREKVNSIPSDDDAVYPDADVEDHNSYEAFGTKMSENLLLSLGYFTDGEIRQRRDHGLPLPPPSLWASNNLRRPFALVMNAIASMRTFRSGHLGARVQKHLGRDSFEGLRIVTTGRIPEGGFSSSSAVVVATENAVNALWNLGLSPDTLVNLACQAEYGTGVRAGSLDQATEQKGRYGVGTVMSSNPRENYKILAAYPVPSDRIRILFPYTVERDRAAWRWSYGFHGQTAGEGPLTPGEFRKMTGKSAEIAALLIRLPLDVDFFKEIEHGLVETGKLTAAARRRACEVLLALPELISQQDLRGRVEANSDWYAEQLMEQGLDPASARDKTASTIASLFQGWRDASLRRTAPDGAIVEERGVPLRAMLAYLYGEVAKNFHLIHHQDEWIETVTRSQGGDRCFIIDPDALPDRAAMERELDWERGASGPALLDRWLEKHGASPFDFNRGLDDESLRSGAVDFHRLEGSNFFRGLALIDLAEAMLKRAFGGGAVAVRVNAAGQGDFFQVHVDLNQAGAEDVKRFLSVAFYRRFGLSPSPDFVEVFPGGGAVGVRLDRYDSLPVLIRRLRDGQ